MVQVSVARATKVIVPPRRIPRYVALAFLGVISLVGWSMYSFFLAIKTTPFRRNEPQTIFRTFAGDPIPTQEDINGTDVLYVEPDEINGILFVAHGCSRSHTDWFVDCERCIGLPEERAIVMEGLELGFIVVAISSKDRHRKCWGRSEDVERVGPVLQEMSNRYGSNWPILLFGVSSGGAFVNMAATPLVREYGLPVIGFISQIFAATFLKDTTSKCRVYITMNKDEATDHQAEGLVTSILRPTSRNLHIRIPPLPIQSDYFTKRIPEISFEQSKEMAASLKTKGFLDENDFLIDNPRQSDWRAVIQPILPLAGLERDTLTASQSPIAEVMNVADGFHEITRDGVQEAMKFCLSRASPSASPSPPSSSSSQP